MSRVYSHRHAILPETAMLALLGCADLLATVYLLATGQAREANPLMAAVLQQTGPRGLITFKALLLGIPLMVVEAARHKRPRFVRRVLRIGVAAYAVMLIAGYVRGLTPG